MAKFIDKNHRVAQPPLQKPIPPRSSTPLSLSLSLRKPTISCFSSSSPPPPLVLLFASAEPHYSARFFHRLGFTKAKIGFHEWIGLHSVRTWVSALVASSSPPPTGREGGPPSLSSRFPPRDSLLAPITRCRFDDSAKPRNVDRDISRRWNTLLSAKELRPCLSAITFLAKGYIYVCVCVHRDRSREWIRYK